MKHKGRAVREGEIVEAARRVFSERGPYVSVRDIAREAGCSEGLVYLYFTTKAGLWAAAMEGRV